jgi:hypothetical protein
MNAAEGSLVEAGTALNTGNNIMITLSLTENHY